MQTKLAILIAILIAFIGYSFGLYKYGRHVENIKQESIRLKAVNDSQIRNNRTIKELEIKHDKEKTILGGFIDIAPPPVRLPKRSCPSTQPTAIGGVPAIPSDRILLADAERILEEDRQRTWQIIGLAEHELIGCRIVKEWAVKQGE